MKNPESGVDRSQGEDYTMKKDDKMMMDKKDGMSSDKMKK